MISGARHGRVVLALAIFCVAGEAAAQNRPPVFDIVLGTHLSQLPEGIFVAPACAGGGETTALRLGPEAVAACAPDADGIVTLAFRHDDTAEYEALARGNAAVAARDSLNTVGGAPAEFALRVDSAGRVVGTMVTAPATAEVFAGLQATAAGAWTCTGPAAPGTHCSIEADGATLVLDWPAAGGPIVLTAAPVGTDLPAAALGLAEPKPETRSGPPYAGRLAAFLAGASVECPGCDLADADLRYRDLSGADLTDADLSGALLHGSILDGANLTGAQLTGANLNRTSLAGAVFRGADLSSALIFAAAAPAADFTGAGLSSAILGGTDFSDADFSGASLDGANLAGADLDAATLFFATLRYAVLDGATFAGADLRGAIASDATATGAAFVGANLSDAAFTRSDLRRADLSSAVLTGADFVDTLLEGAILAGAILDGADFTGAVPAPIR